MAAAAAVPALGGPNIIFLNRLRTSFVANTDPPTTWYIQTLRGSLRDLYNYNVQNEEEEAQRREDIIDDILSQIEEKGYRFCPKRNQLIENTANTKVKRRNIVRQNSRDMLRVLATEEGPVGTSTIRRSRGSVQSRGLLSQSSVERGEWSELLRQTIASETRARRSEMVKNRVVDRKFVREISFTEKKIRREDSKKSGIKGCFGTKNDVVEG